MENFRTTSRKLSGNSFRLLVLSEKENVKNACYYKILVNKLIYHDFHLTNTPFFPI